MYLPIRLEPIGFRLTWEMICAAKNDEKKMFAKLVQNATKVQNVLDNFIISIIDEENNSLLHYLVVWGYDDGLQLLETESTWETTLENKQKLTPVHFAAYLGRHKFLELFSKKTGKVEPNIRNRIKGKLKEAAQKEKNLIRLLEDGEKKTEQDTFKEFHYKVNEHLVSSLTSGTESQYDDSRRMIENFFSSTIPE